MQTETGDNKAEKINFIAAVDEALGILHRTVEEQKREGDGELSILPDHIYAIEAKLFRARRLYENGYAHQQVEQAIPGFTDILRNANKIGNEINEELENS